VCTISSGVNGSYFRKVNPLFPVISQDIFMSAYRRVPDSRALSDHIAWAVFLAASSFTDDARLLDGPHSRLQIEKRLKQACDRELARGHSNLCLIPALILGQLFPAKRERKVALLSWTINGRAVKLALQHKLNIDLKEIDAEMALTRISTWWCVYIVDIWDAARRGRPASIHEGDYDVPLPIAEKTSSEEEKYFVRLLHLTKILARVLSFGYNNTQTSSTLAGPIDFATEERIRDLRRQLANWYHAETLPRSSLLYENLQVAYLTVVILLHRPLLPTPLATEFQDPVLLLITQCASQIVAIAQRTSDQVAGSVPWRLFVPAVGYLTAGITLAQNAAWSSHISGATPLRISASKDINTLIDIFDTADSKGHNTAGMSGLLKSIFERSGVDRSELSQTVPEIPGTPLPFPHENPAFAVNHFRPSPEKAATLPEKRHSGQLLQTLAPLSLPPPRAHTESDLSFRKRKHAQISHLSTPTHKSSPQQLPSLSTLTGVDPGRRSPGVRSVHSMSTFSSHSSGSHHQRQGYQVPPSTAYHPSYNTPPDPPRPRHWEQRAHSPSLPPIYDRRYSESSNSYPGSSRDFPAHQPPPPNPYYPPREEYYTRPVSPYPAHEPVPYPQRPEVHRVPSDPRYRHPTPPLSAAPSNPPSWPAGYPYPQRYEAPPPPHPPPAPQNRGWPVRDDYYYPPPRG